MGNHCVDDLCHVLFPFSSRLVRVEFGVVIFAHKLKNNLGDWNKAGKSFLLHLVYLVLLTIMLNPIECG